MTEHNTVSSAPDAHSRRPLLSTRTWVILICSAAIALAALSWLLLGAKRDSRVVQVIQDGRVLQEIDLNQVTEEYTFTVEWPQGGSNTVTVQPGRIRISKADCPDRICVSQGWLTDQAAPVVCLPHRLVLQLKSQAEAAADGVVR